MAEVHPLIIVGAGGFGRETLDLVRAVDPHELRWKFIGFVAKSNADLNRLGRLGATRLGDDEAFLRSPSATHYVVAIGDPATRQRIVDRYNAAGLTPISLVHPSAAIGSDVRIGEGAVICAHSSITTNVEIGRHVHVDRVTTIGHDSVIEDFVTLHPSSVISGGVRIRSGTRVGTNSCVLPGLTVGRDVIVGAGAVVTRDVPASSVVTGVPAVPVQARPTSSEPTLVHDSQRYTPGPLASFDGP